MDLWRQFEHRIKNETRAMGGAITHIPSHIQQTRGKKVRMKTDCDFAFGIDGRAGFLDAKSCAGKRFYFSDHKTFNDEKIHQYTFLMQAFATGSQAGYLVWLYDKRLILWAPIGVVAGLKVNNELGFDETTTGVRMQKDDEPINLRKLIWGN